jgi:hypothetical protein
MSQADIQAAVNAIYARQVDNEMGTARYALLFEPGTYGSQNNPLDVPVGYYTEVDGLGQDPSAVVINGGVTAIGKNGSGALDIFWRSVSNLTIHVVATADGCHTSNEMWAVSQAAPMRRVDVKDFTTFMPYCENPNFASGGFVADSWLGVARSTGRSSSSTSATATWVPAGPTTCGTRSSLATSPRPRRTSGTATPTRPSHGRR